MRNYCSVEGCNNFCVGLGYCNKHYSRIRTTGKVTKPLVQRGHILYNTYRAMRNRCIDSSLHMYHGRGIKVCDRWLGAYGFENFVNDMGLKPSPQHSIDRINNDGNYQPDNCRWATPKEQANNRNVPVRAKANSNYVYFKKGLWQVRKLIKGKDTHFGLFKTKDEALTKSKELGFC